MSNSRHSRLDKTDKQTNKLLVWTQTGSWVQVPMLEGFMGGDPKSYKVARKEKYINEEGEQREAISYGVDHGLTVWYDMEEMRRAQPQWIPTKRIDMRTPGTSIWD